MKFQFSNLAHTWWSSLRQPFLRNSLLSGTAATCRHAICSDTSACPFGVGAEVSEQTVLPAGPHAWQKQGPARELQGHTLPLWRTGTHCLRGPLAAESRCLHLCNRRGCVHEVQNAEPDLGGCLPRRSHPTGQNATPDRGSRWVAAWHCTDPRACFAVRDSLSQVVSHQWGRESR